MNDRGAKYRKTKIGRYILTRVPICLILYLESVNGDMVMKKQQIQQLLTLVNTLEKARQECLHFMETGNSDIAMNLLGDCQDTVFKMIEFIGQIQKEQSKTAAFLEQLYKLLYQISIAILARKKWENDFEEMRQLLEKARCSIRDDWKPAPTKMLFLPYKASMWDSLESIWIAAKNDSECEAVVVPIPYYDKNSDGSLGQMYYEGGDFPSYVPVVNWQEYDLAEESPDVAFIHNPYDDCNAITQVYSLYFSDNLKKYVGLLCYTPYFVTLKNISPHFAVLPAVLNSDFVFVESEQVRQHYLQVWTDMVREKQAGANALAIMQRKIVALGSPKYDAVMNDTREAVEVPDNWKRVFENPNGKRKNVVFYNTSITALLKNTLSTDGKISNQYFDKLECVLRFFRQHKEKAVLLWRPHPLLAQTLRSMRPQLYQRYLQIVRRFCEEAESGGWGIYDDSPDLHRAIAVSDVYYGDSSSVVSLFQAAGKPVLTQNTNILDDWKHLVVGELYFDGDFIWCTACDFNGLFRINSKTIEIEYVGQFPGEKAEGYQLFCDIAEHNGKLYFCPYNAKDIAIYDKRTQKFSRIPLDENIRDIDRKFASILIHDSYVYLQGSRVYAIVRINIETSGITYIKDWVEDIEQRKIEDFEFYIQRGCIHDGMLYYPAPSARALLCISIDDLSHSFIPLQYSNANGFSKILSDGRLLWLLQYTCVEGRIAYYDTQMSRLTELAKINSASSFCRLNEYIYYFSISDSLFYRVNTESKEIVTLPIETGIYPSVAVGSKIFMASYLTGEFYIFDTDNLKTEKVHMTQDSIQFPKLNDIEMINENKKFNQYARESGFLNIESLLGISMADIVQPTLLAKGCCGSAIYEYVKGLIL